MLRECVVGCSDSSLFPNTELLLTLIFGVAVVRISIDELSNTLRSLAMWTECVLVSCSPNLLIWKSHSDTSKFDYQYFTNDLNAKGDGALGLSHGKRI